MHTGKEEPVPEYDNSPLSEGHREKVPGIKTTYRDIKPEYGVIVIICRFLDIRDSRDEARILQGIGYQRKTVIMAIIP